LSATADVGTTARRRVPGPVGADLLRDAVVVAGDHLDRHVEAVQPVQRLVRVSLRAIDEREEAGEIEVVLVLFGQGFAAAVGDAGGDGDHAAAFGELSVDDGLCVWGDG
jgi:hypothetical protein